MPWVELSLRLRQDAYAETEALLQLAGALSIAVADAGDSPILEPAVGSTPLWPTLIVRALFPDTVDIDGVCALLGSNAASVIEVRRISESEIDTSVQQAIAPIDIGPRLAIVPADTEAPLDARALRLHIGLAFGTGQHPTTQLCLEWLEQEFRAGESLLDYGAGTGVLALAALKLGAAQATAIDNEPQALTATRQNAELNGLAAALRIGQPEELGNQQFDCIVANILAGPLHTLAPEFARRQRAGGRIALSGILAAQLDELQARYAAVGYTQFARRLREDWGLLTALRDSEYDR